MPETNSIKIFNVNSLLVALIWPAFVATRITWGSNQGKWEVLTYPLAMHKHVTERYCSTDVLLATLTGSPHRAREMIHRPLQYGWLSRKTIGKAVGNDTKFDRLSVVIRMWYIDPTEKSMDRKSEWTCVDQTVIKPVSRKQKVGASKLLKREHDDNL